MSVKNYSFSRCYCKIVVCRYVDSLICRIGNGIYFAKKLMFKKFVRCELSLDGIPALEKMVDVKNVHKKVLSFVSSRRFGKWHTLTYMTGVF